MRLIRRNDKVNILPDVGKWCFQTWQVDFFVFCPVELTITKYEITLIVRVGHRIFKWEYRRKAVFESEEYE